MASDEQCNDFDIDLLTQFPIQIQKEENLGRKYFSTLNHNRVLGSYQDEKKREKLTAR